MFLVKKKLSANYVFRKYRLKTIYNRTNFSRYLDSQLILFVTAQSIFTVEPSAWVRWKGILLDFFFKYLSNAPKHLVVPQKLIEL
jgi:hypothetical protein